MVDTTQKRIHYFDPLPHDESEGAYYMENILHWLCDESQFSHYREKNNIPGENMDKRYAS